MDNDNQNFNETDTVNDTLHELPEASNSDEGNFNEIEVSTDSSEGNFNEIGEDGSMLEPLPEEQTASPKSNDKSGKNRSLLGIVIALAIVIIGLIIFLIIALINKDKKEPASAVDNNGQTVTSVADPNANPDGGNENNSNIPTQALETREFNVSVKLGNYKGLSADYEVPPVTDEDIESEMEYFLASVKEKSPITDRELKEGDVAVIDFIGTMDGIAFDGGTAENYELELGSHSFIDGFESGLIGKKVGDSVSLNLTFPENYGNTELAGKAVIFDVTINEAYESVTPELTDELVAANTSFATIEEYKKAAREEFEKYNEEYADSMMKDDLIKQVIDSSEFTGEIAEEIAYEEESALQYYDIIMQQYYGIDGATYFQYYYGFTEEEYKLFIHEQADFQVKYVHILDEIIKAEGLTLSEEEKTGDETEELELLRGKAENIIFDSAIINNITQK